MIPLIESPTKTKSNSIFVQVEAPSVVTNTGH